MRTSKATITKDEDKFIDKKGDSKSSTILQPAKKSGNSPENIPSKPVFFLTGSKKADQRLFINSAQSTEDENKLQNIYESLSTKNIESVIREFDEIFNDPRVDKKTKVIGAYNFGLYLRVMAHKYDIALRYLDKGLQIIGEVEFINPEASVQLKSALHLEKGRNYKAVGNKDKATELFKLAIKECPFNYDAYISYGILFQDKENYSEAIKRYEFAIELNPDRDSGYVNFACCIIQMYYRKKCSANELHKALSYVNKALQLNHDNLTAYKNRSEIRELLKDAAGAIEDASKVVALAPLNSESYTILGNIYLFEARFDQAREQYLKALKLEPMDHMARLHLGNIEYLNRNYEAALVEFKNILAIDPLYLPALINATSACINMRQFDVALDYLDLIISKNLFLSGEDLSKIYDQVGLIMACMGFYDEAAVAYNKSLSSTKEQERMVEVRLCLGNVYFDQKKYPEATTQYHEALKSAKSEHWQFFEKLIKEAELYQKVANQPNFFESDRPKDRVNSVELSPLVLKNIGLKADDCLNANNNWFLKDGIFYFPSLIPEEVKNSSNKIYELKKGSDNLWYKKRQKFGNLKLATGDRYYDFVVVKEADQILIRIGTIGHYKPIGDENEISRLTGLPLDAFKPRFAIIGRLNEKLRNLEEQHKVRRPKDDLKKFTEAVPELTNGDKRVAKSLLNITNFKR